MGATKITKDKLTAEQEKFCHIYASDREFFGNGTQSYMSAYNVPSSKILSAMSAAGRLLRNDKILRRINQIMEIHLTDAHVDKQLALVVIQNADFKAKVSAIKEYNALKQRVKNKLELTGTISLTELFTKAKKEQ